MKKSILIVLFCTAWLLSFGQKNGPRVITRGDDMGSTHSANVANLQCIEAGIMKDIQLMVVTPWFPEAAIILKDHKDIEVGLHFTINSEWTNYKWRPITQCPSLVDEDGYFLPVLTKFSGYEGLSTLENKWKLEELEQELRAQIKLCRKYIPWANNITYHFKLPMEGTEKIREMMARVAKEYNMIWVSPDFEEKFINVSVYAGPKDTPDGYIAWLKTLEPGKLYSSGGHPALNDAETSATSMKERASQGVPRQKSTDIYTSKAVKKIIDDLGIVTVGYGDVANVDLTPKK
jgi:hypothetical protein